MGELSCPKRYLVNFMVKISHLVATIFRSFSGNETPNWGTGWPSGNILVQTNCFQITMAWKMSCKDVATHVGRFALHIIFFAWALGGSCVLPPIPTSNDARLPTPLQAMTHPFPLLSTSRPLPPPLTLFRFPPPSVTSTTP